MSSIAGSGGYKAPAGVSSRNDGGGPGSGNFYFQNGQYEEEQPNYNYDDPMNHMGENPFESLLYIAPSFAAQSSNMPAFKSIAAQLYYKQYLKKKDLELATASAEEAYPEEDYS